MRNHRGFLVGITRLGRAVVAAHNAQSGYRANAVCAVRRDDFQEELWRGVHVLSGVNWLQRKQHFARNSVHVNK
jgi:hypothetical protein